MFKLRIKFERTGDIKYIGHLDMISVFSRALKRAKIDVSHTKGFNPRPIMVFALPLSVGLETVGDYLDIELETMIDEEELIARINEKLPSGIRTTKAKYVESKNIMSLIELASYDIIYNIDTSRAVEIFDDKDEVKVEKKNKKGNRIIDIKPLVISVSSNGNKVSCFLKAGSKANLRSDLLANALLSKGMEVEKIIRTGLYIIENGKIKDPI